MKFFCRKHISVLTFYTPISQNDQTHPNNSSASADFSCLVFFSYVASSSCQHAEFIAYLSGKSFALNKEKADKPGRILILAITLYADQYILINLYNADTDTKEVQILEQL